MWELPLLEVRHPAELQPSVAVQVEFAVQGVVLDAIPLYFDRGGVPADTGDERRDSVPAELTCGPHAVGADPYPIALPCHRVTVVEDDNRVEQTACSNVLEQCWAGCVNQLPAYGPNSALPEGEPLAVPDWVIRWRQCPRCEEPREWRYPSPRSRRAQPPYQQSHRRRRS